MPRFYELEVPEKVITERGEIHYFKQAKKLQVSLGKWKTLDGEVKQGKTVTIDLTHFKGNEELKSLLEMVIADLEAEPA
ncbi:hypothetical protein HYG86_11370 [Alkalicella caledoniensis]|uniref:Uncharacterized protein n=1 Tax=Alkalicella caledoniensis TaxID=2731377 RepID=A0A7G9W9G0_ALKCA|nr:hypothetical protein [Alkalicella caledoniensis]QNO15322.1 hypothetical protein HYG86_11370 [Alkalicella caledoniensis]